MDGSFRVTRAKQFGGGEGIGPGWAGQRNACRGLGRLAHKRAPTILQSHTRSKKPELSIWVCWTHFGLILTMRLWNDSKAKRELSSATNCGGCEIGTCIRFPPEQGFVLIRRAECGRSSFWLSARKNLRKQYQIMVIKTHYQFDRVDLTSAVWTLTRFSNYLSRNSYETGSILGSKLVNESTDHVEWSTCLPNYHTNKHKKRYERKYQI